jgi:LacI family transcriptional regulator
MASLSDVAREAGVSISLVSRVLSRRMGNVHATTETQARIRQAAQRLGYVPLRSAQSLVRRKSGTIGLVVPRPAPETCGRDAWNSHYLHQIISAMETECAAVGYHCLFSHWAFDADGLSHPRAMLDRSVDGVLLADFTRGGVVKELLTLGLPCAQIGSNIESTVPIDRYYGDLEQAVAVAVHKLAADGLGKLVLYGGVGPGVGQIADAFHAAAEREAALKASFVRIDGSEEHAHALDWTAQLLQPGGAGVGCISLSAPFAIALAEALAVRGRMCPADYSLVSVVTEGWPTIHLPGWVPLSTISLPNFDVARAATRDLLARVNARRGAAAAPPRAHLFPCPVTWRGSTRAECLRADEAP